MECRRLFLRSPLEYTREALDPFGPLPKGTERLFCFSLEPSEAGRIDPDPARCLGPLRAAGSRRFPGPPPEPPEAPLKLPEDSPEPQEDVLELPAGLYYFTQVRAALEGLAALGLWAAELQKEGLWERLGLGSALYLRLLHEDGAPVSQLWRAAEIRGSTNDANEHE